jgi:hypothetical protein
MRAPVLGSKLSAAESGSHTENHAGAQRGHGARKKASII